MKLSRYLFLVALVFCAPVQAQAQPRVPTGASAAAPASATAQGVVRKVDKTQGKVTLRHGPIASLDMPSMTMVFKVADAKMLDAIKEGDKVSFAAARVNGAITVTAIEAVK